MSRWIVLDVDDGALRFESSREKAVDWVKGWLCSHKIRRRWCYGPGIYEYRIGDTADEAEEVLVVREERLPNVRRASVGEAPLYPYETEPFMRKDRDTQT